MQDPSEIQEIHAFERNPHRTLFALSVPVMLSFVVQPLAGVVDTAFVERLGASSSAALGAATALLATVAKMIHMVSPFRFEQGHT